MRLKTKYIIYIILIHGIFLVISLIIFKYNRILFLVAEAGLIISLIVILSFYRTILRPFRLLQAGVESIHDKDFSMKFLPVGQPDLDRLIDVFNKMIDQLRVERAISIEKNFFLDKLIEASPAAIIIFDKNNHLQNINPAAMALFDLAGHSSVPVTIEELPSPWDHELSKPDETDTHVIQFNGINQYKCYKSFFIDRGVKQSFFIIEELTKELLKAERQSYEKVIRMMSHEVNNSVGSVNSIIDSTIDYMSKNNNSKNDEYVKVLNVAKKRIINLNLFTRRFADIVHIPSPQVSECNIAGIVDHVLTLFSVDLEKNNIEVVKVYPDEVPMILFDSQQMELVLINIIKNAIQAIHTSGRIDIIFRNDPPVLHIENTGDPITEDIQKELFKPFFTTKRTGQGIGLTLIREILANHSCGFSLQTRNDGVTEFVIDFGNQKQKS